MLTFGAGRAEAFLTCGVRATIIRLHSEKREVSDVSPQRRKETLQDELSAELRRARQSYDRATDDNRHAALRRYIDALNRFNRVLYDQDPDVPCERDQ